MKKAAYGILMVAMAVFMLSGPATAGVPNTLSYQGYLRDGAGAPLTNTVSVVFTIYDVASGGNILWSELQSVAVRNGVFAASLGSVTPFPANLFSGPDRYVGIQVGADPEMTPRQKIHSAAFSLKAAEADSLSSTAILGTANQIVSTVPIGTAPFQVSSTTAVTNLNADMVDGKHASDFASAGANTNITSLSGLNAQAAITVQPYGTTSGNTGEMRMAELAANGTNYVGFKAPDSIIVNNLWTLPAADGTASQVLKTDGAGKLGWADLNSTVLSSVTGTDPNGVMRGTNTATLTSGYLGGSQGAYGQASGDNTTAVFGKNMNADLSTNLGYGVKGQSGNSVGILGINRVCRNEPYDCNCDWGGTPPQWSCDTCYNTVCDAQPAAGVYGQATAPAYAGYFAGNVYATGTLQATNVVGNGSGLTNVAASTLSINCDVGQILKKTAGGWQCSAPCETGDFVNCYSGDFSTINVGACRAGKRVCERTGFGACVGEVLPAAETCGHVDADCNGVVDDARDFPGCVVMYRDRDGDGYGDPQTSICSCATAAGYVTNNQDCNDNNANVHPGVTTYQVDPIPGTTPPSWDYSCSGSVAYEYTGVSSGCALLKTVWGSGWVDTFAECGVTADWRTCVCAAGAGCSESVSPRTQRCY